MATTQPKKKGNTKKIKGVSIQVMTEGKGLYQRFIEGITKDDILWIDAAELLEPEGVGRVVFVNHIREKCS